jgi:hypothetical protein
MTSRVLPSRSPDLTTVVGLSANNVPGSSRHVVTSCAFVLSPPNDIGDFGFNMMVHLIGVGDFYSVLLTT